MGRLTKTKIDEIRKLRKQGYTQKETAEKVRVHVRTVRKYDPLREQDERGVTFDAQKETLEDLKGLVARGLARETDKGYFLITLLGRRVKVIMEELEERAILEYMAEAGRPVALEEIERYIAEVGDDLLERAIYEATS